MIIDSKFRVVVFFCISIGLLSDPARGDVEPVGSPPVKHFFVAGSLGLAYLADLNTMISASAGYRFSSSFIVLAEASGSTSYESDYGNHDKSKMSAIAVKYALVEKFFIKGGFANRNFEARQSNNASGPFKEFKCTDTLGVIGIGALWQSDTRWVTFLGGWEVNLLHSLGRKVEYNTYSGEPLSKSNFEAKAIIGLAF